MPNALVLCPPPLPTIHIPRNIALCLSPTALCPPVHCPLSLFTFDCPLSLSITLSTVPTVHCILLTSMPPLLSMDNCPLFTAFAHCPQPPTHCRHSTAHCPLPLIIFHGPLPTAHYSLYTVHSLSTVHSLFTVRYYSPLLTAHCPLSAK
jgi:hypothetical protein